ncbi:MAG TPA: hypothetical protein VGC41_00415, partial [Kofleriaceae bacterium]
MAKRGGPSISVKMILTTTLLIVVTVVGSGFLNVVNIRRAFDASTIRRIDTFQDGREQLGIAGTQQIASALTPFLIDKHDEEIDLLVKSAVGRDNRTDPKGRVDYGLRMAYVLDLNQNVIVSCLEKAALDCVKGNHEPMSAKFGDLEQKSWQTVLGTWKKGGDPLVNFIPKDNAEYRILAFPIFSGEQPTAAAA